MPTINTPEFGKIFATADSFDDLRIIPSVQLRKGYWALVAGATVPGDDLGGLFVWDDHSTAPDDDETVIRPTESSGAGRWIAMAAGRVGAQGATGPAGPVGPQADPSVLSVAGQTGDITASNLRASLDLEIGTDVQPYNPNLSNVASITGAGVVLVRTANGFKPATLSGITLAGTADAPVLTAASMREETIYAMRATDNQSGFYYADVAQTVSYTGRIIGNPGTVSKSSAANSTSFTTFENGTLTNGKTGSTTLEAGATLRVEAGNGSIAWLHVKRTT